MEFQMGLQLFVDRFYENCPSQETSWLNTQMFFLCLLAFDYVENHLIFGCILEFFTRVRKLTSQKFHSHTSATLTSINADHQQVPTN